MVLAIQTRYLNHNVPGGGGGPVANVAWGPDFGEDNGADGVTRRVGVNLDLESLAIVNEKTVGVHPNLDSLAVVMNTQGVGVHMTQDASAVFNAQAVGVDMIGDLAAIYGAKSVGVAATNPTNAIVNEKTVGTHLSGSVLGAPFWQSVETGTGTTSIVVNKPAGVAVGDLLLAFIGAQEAAASPPTAITAPLGWFAVTTVSNSAMRSGVFTRVVDGTEGSTFTFTVTPNTAILRGVGEVHHITGVAFNAWNPSKGAYVAAEDKSIAAQETIPADIAFKPDGTKMFVVGSANNTVKTYDLSTAWSPSTGTYNAAQDKSVAAQDINVNAFAFKPDGTKMFVLGSENNTVKTYDLSTAWDPSTASYDSGQDKSVTVQVSTPTALAFKPDGTKMFVFGPAACIVKTYDLSTAWDPSTGTYNAAQDKSVFAQEGNVGALAFKPDGTKMFVIGSNNNTVKTYDLSTVWNPSTGTYGGSAQDKSVVAWESGSSGLAFKPDGTTMFFLGNISDIIRTYAIASVNNFATAILDAAALDPDPDAPSVTTTVVNCTVFAHVLHDHLTLSQTHTPGASHVERTDFQGDTAGTTWLGSVSQTRTFAAAGATGTIAFDCTETVATDAIMVRVAIAPGTLVIAT